jgi:hypothetical protein
MEPRPCSANLRPVASLILQRLSTILRRELGAEEVRVLADDEDVEETATTMVGRLGRARQVLVRFAEPPLDMQDKRARLAAFEARKAAAARGAGT